MKEQTVPLRPLSLVEEGDEVLVGDPESGTFVTLPTVGGVVISLLQRGAPLDEVAAKAEEYAGEPVDIPAFVETLRELGFVEDAEAPAPARTAPIQGRRWLRGIRQELVRPFFGRTAWTCYGLFFAFDVAVLIGVPALFPRPADDAFFLGDIGLSALLLAPFGMLSMAVHECGHWLAARAIGVKARFGVDRRMMMLVFETDLTQVWSVPRRRRYSPLLGGMAVDSVVLGCLLSARLLIHAGVWSPPAVVDSLLAAWVLVKLVGFLWQCMVFLRTDLYAVMVNALGCRNLWRVKSLMLRRAFGRLTSAEATELAEAAPADIRAARWFRWVWLAGFLGVAAWFAVFVLPVVLVVLHWTGNALALGPFTGRFWYGIFCTTLLLGPDTVAAVLAVREAASRLFARFPSPNRAQ
ncbi:PqqD family protein [Actinomadura roseirufa]|uniref:PqqD family protein n=1 Tax=Actinomadura roseirufa TaxID=2094049 RepID=UPI0010414514|nr:PqqD family protein [Actinomadura roseirufa]